MFRLTGSYASGGNIRTGEPHVLRSSNEVVGSVGTRFGPSPWIVVDQSDIDAFAAAIDDWQWVHVDPDRSKAGQYGRTVAHGNLTLSLIPAMWDSIVRVENCVAVVNYGYDRVRFPAALPSGGRIRLLATVGEVMPVAIDVLHVKTLYTVECDIADRPVLYAEKLQRFYY